MSEDEYKMMDALGQVCDYFYEIKSIITETNSDEFYKLKNEYFVNIERAQKTFNKMCCMT